MPCTSPITMASDFGTFQVRCKQCLQCRILKQSSLTLRCLLENQTTLYGEFWTLTYKDAPEKGDYKDFSKFLKRLRKHNHKHGNKLPIRYLACGEYGTQSGRFHYHALIWNTLPTQMAWHERLWPHGFVYIGTITPSSIRYTARYTLKFAHKGKEAMANWSKGYTNPKTGIKHSLPLGADGAMQLGNFMRERGDAMKEPPSHFSIDGTTYPLDQAMKKAFWNAYDGSDPIPRHPLTMNLEHIFMKRFGDPVLEEAKRKEARKTFFNSAQFIHEKI